MSDKFWIEQPDILFKHGKVLEVWPYKSMSFTQQLNATTRFVILTSLIGYMLLNNYIVLLLGVILALLIIVIYKFNKKRYLEGMTSSCPRPEIDPTHNNPFQNVLMTDYVDNPHKAQIKAEYNDNIEDKINTKVKSFIYKNNEDNKDIANIFANLSDNMEFEQSLRQFNINPSTSIPNSQADFLKYCYNDLYSEKPLNIY